MTRLALTLTVFVAATPAFANYGDLASDLQVVKHQPAQVSQPLVTPSYVVASDGTCSLPADHIVMVPTTFTAESGEQLACLTDN